MKVQIFFSRKRQILTGVEDVAQNGLRKQINATERSDFINMEQQPVNQSASNEQVIKDFENFLSYERFLTFLTIRAYMRNVRAFCKFLKSDLFSQIPLLDVKKEDISRFLIYLKQRETGKSPNTVASYIASLRIFYAWAAYKFSQNNLLDDTFFLKNIIKAKQELKIPFIPKREDIEKLRHTLKTYKELQAHDKKSYAYKKTLMAYTIFELFLTTGMRSNELRMLCLKDIDLVNKTIHVRYGKGGNERISLFWGNAGELLAEYILLNNFQPEDRIFPVKSGNVLHYMVKRWAKKANVDPRLHIHAFRHYHITESQKQGVSIPSVAAQVGHTDWNSTKRYSHYDVDFMKQQYTEKNI